jgi:hypothetical protein
VHCCCLPTRRFCAAAALCSILCTCAV